MWTCVNKERVWVMRVLVRMWVTARVRKRVAIWKLVWMWASVSRCLRTCVMKLQYCYQW